MTAEFWPISAALSSPCQLSTMRTTARLMRPAAPKPCAMRAASSQPRVGLRPASSQNPPPTQPVGEEADCRRHQDSRQRPGGDHQSGTLHGLAEGAQDLRSRADEDRVVQEARCRDGEHEGAGRPPIGHRVTLGPVGRTGRHRGRDQPATSRNRWARTAGVRAGRREPGGRVTGELTSPIEPRRSVAEPVEQDSLKMYEI